MAFPDETTTIDRPESPAERRARRRVRRWKRRARMAGPFLGLPILVGALALSVDLIEYDPEPVQDRLSDRPIPPQVLDRQRQNQERVRDRDREAAAAGAALSMTVSTTSVVDMPSPPDPRDLDLRLEPGSANGRDDRATRLPYAARGGR